MAEEAPAWLGAASRKQKEGSDETPSWLGAASRSTDSQKPSPPEGWEAGGTPNPSNPHGWRQVVKPEPRDTLAGYLAGPFDAAATISNAAVVGLPASAIEAFGTPQKASEFSQKYTRSPSTLTGQRLIESFGDMMHGDVGRTLASIPGLGKEVSILSRLASPAAAQARAAASPVVARAIDATLNKVPGVNLHRSLGSFKKEYGDAGDKLLNRGNIISDMERENAGSLLQKTGLRKNEYERVVKGAEGVASRAPDKSMERHLGVAEAKTPHEIGSAMKEPFEARINEEFEKLGALGKEKFPEAIEHGKQLEAAGRGFNQSKQGQGLVKELQQMKKPGPGGHSSLSAAEEKKVDSLIELVQGGSGKPPAGTEPLMNELRYLRKYNENTAAATEGADTISKKFAEKLVGAFKPKLHDWNPKLGEADVAYKAAKQELNKFNTELMSKARRGEKFDFRQLAADPAEYPKTIFKSQQSVQQFKAAVGNDAMVKQAASEWAASELKGLPADKAKAWATKNADWLREAGIEKNVAKHAEELALQERALGGMKGRAEAKTETLDLMKKKAQGDIESSGVRRVARQKVADQVRVLVENPDPKTISDTVRSKVIPDLRSTGLMSESDIAKLAQQVKAIDTTFQGTEKAKRISKYLATAIGGAGAYGAYKATQ
jgi:hypothetical protein